MTERAKSSPHADTTNEIHNAQMQMTRLHEQCLTLMLATRDADGQPCASYTPYAFFAGQYYIFISGLAAHTQHIRTHPQVGLLIIEDEQNARNLYARARLSYQARATLLARESDECERALMALCERAGNTVDLLAQMGDFVMVRLTPENGTLVLGFGKAYELNGANPEQLNWISADRLRAR